jgi:solute carrier family 10 (sodium/bile acid cotransporter), member 7
VCSASFSNLAGIFLTPILVAVLMTGKSGGFSASSAERIGVQLLLPFVAGHLLRPWIGGWVIRQRRVLSLVDRGSILLVVYTAFAAAVTEGLWSRVSASDLAIITALSAALLAVVLLLSHLAGRWLGFSREDRIVLQFCGSKKSLASGVPMAGVLFPAAQIGAIILPLMIFHQIQLMVCAMLARRYGATQENA